MAERGSTGQYETAIPGPSAVRPSPIRSFQRRHES